MEAYVLTYKVRRFVMRLWYWTRQILLVGLLLALLLLVWRWQDRTAEHIRSGQGDSITVVDGDSIVLRQGEARQTIRISGIDAPEYRQSCTDEKGAAWACGKEARTALETIIANHALQCAVDARDAYQRAVASCSVEGVADIGREMVRRGMAVSGAETTDSRYNDGGPYLREEAETARAKRGIWRGPFERPADWRVRHPRAPED